MLLEEVELELDELLVLGQTAPTLVLNGVVLLVPTLKGAAGTPTP